MNILLNGDFQHGRMSDHNVYYVNDLYFYVRTFHMKLYSTNKSNR